MLNLEKRYCPICRGEVVFTYERPSTTFSINEKGTLSVCDNNFGMGPELVPHCENDKEHVIQPQINTKLYVLWERWLNTIEEYFFDNNLGGKYE